MSNMKKKKMKQPTRLRTLVASLMLIAPALHAANDTEFSPRPLVGVAASFAPHIALALSVEFPTAGAAYPTYNILSVRGNTSSSPMTQTYLGYFDNTKCYKYNHTGGYFEPSSKAVNEKGYYGLCNAGGEDKEEFSGNLLNFMTMTAIDIFRSAMTGGNRAMGTGITQTDYTSADTPNTTFLRRANVINRNGIGNAMGTYRIRDRQFNAFNAKANGTLEDVKRLLPHYFVDVMMKDIIAGESTEVIRDTDGYVRNNSNGNFGRPRKLGFRAISGSGSNDAEFTFGDYVTRQQRGEMAGIYDRFSDSRLHFYNDGFTMRIARKVGPTVSIGNGQLLIPSPTSALNLAASTDKYYEYYAVMDENSVESKYRESAKKWAKPLNVVVKVCDASVGLEENCQPYGNNHKPEGLLQAYTKSSGMRFATFGYLNIDGNDVDGGVLRSRMKTLVGDKKLDNENYSTVYGDEWNQNTGVFNPNPDTTDASASGVTNSGTINYLNKFGDASGYKANDPAGELYQTALTYLMGSHADINSKKAIYQTTLTDAAKDGFPVIYNWDDPYKRGINPKAQHCHANSIIFIGDTNTHHDTKVKDNESKAETYLKRLFSNEVTLRTTETSNNFGSHVIGRKNDKGEITQKFNPDSGNSPAYMAGLAYWARTNNIRPDLTKDKPGAKPINGSNFMIDVVDSNDYKVRNRYLDDYNPAANTAYYMGNTYYLAAKYGGFTLREDSYIKDLTATADNNKPLPLTRSSWTDDGVGKTSISQFIDGVPRNFALANNPTAMKAALDKAFIAANGLNNPSQAATGLSIGTGEILDLRSEGLNYLLQSTYDYANLTGDVVVYKPSWLQKTNDDGTVERNFGLAEHARTGKLMKEQFHGAGYATRKVFTIKNNQPYEFTSGNASNIFAGITMPANNVTPAQLANYILGDNSLENGILRERAGLQGTVINSTAMPILKAKAVQCNAPFSDTAKNRPTYYAAAANDGMLHIFDTEGNEKMAYMAGTALEKLPEFAKIGFQHQYLNDGTPVIQDLCLNNTSQTVLLGTVGRGGKGVYALNVTDISSPSTQNLMWEFSNQDDPDLGLTVSKPIITKGKDGKQYAVVSSGYQTDGQASDKGYIFILDIGKTGAWSLNGNYWKIPLGKAGVGAPFVYDGENDGIGDKIFVGDLEGQVWQLNRTESGTVPFELKYNGPLFRPNNNFARPITGAPYAEMVNSKLMVTVGTGRYFSDKDLDTKQTNFAYGLIADDKEAIVDSADNILEQRFVETISTKMKNTKVHTVTEAKMENHKGWRLSLMEGMNIASPSLIRQRQVAHFVFARNTGEISALCVRGANAGVIEVDVRSGGRFSRPLIDTNNDGKFDKDDNPNAAAVEFEGMNTSVGTFLNFRNPVTGAIIPAVYFNDGNSSNPGDPTSPFGRLLTLNLLGTEAGVRRISWREIF